LVGTALGGALGIVLAMVLFVGWVVCASTGTSCGDETHTTLEAMGVIAAGAALGAAVGAMAARVLTLERADHARAHPGPDMHG
jgi:hypothetical protein